ncbi:chemerin-like receptor 1 [Pangasianodon hypophthalmus]|uniref:chemerin-like receptor 1 n=1 Tax=Pangasianodon hypophthalmus TaxID=310915 RepID=UPI000EFF5BDE|nr:chemerin-like receptor 1 [Pangasianodon hypophthalmus]
MDSAVDGASNYNDYYDYNNTYPLTPSAPTEVSPSHCTVMCALLATASVIIMVLGIAGNGLVIWIAGFKIKKTVNTVWYLSLAVSDFLFCAFLPLSIVYIIKGDWVFGRFMCKFTSFILFLNMFSSIFLLVIISIDRCVVVMFPVWAQNKRSIRRAWVMVLLAWVLSALLSVPAAIFRHTEIHNSKHVCYYNFTHDEEHVAVVVCRFIFGFVIPFLIIIICYVLIIRKLKNNQMARSNKPFTVMTALIAAFFICWMPYHFFNLLELNLKYASVIPTGQIIGSTLASANSFMNPILYAFMGKDFKRKCYALLSKIESTLEEEARSTLRGTSITYSGDGKLSSTV